ncbi:MAG TPA: extracellular solute-binding protein [Candidatus Nanopelagicaceae bacterium]
MKRRGQKKKLMGAFLAASLLCVGISLQPASAASSVTASDFAKAMNTPTTLTYWTWVPGLNKAIALFEKRYPKIKVNAINVGQGGPHYQKLRVGATSGKGLPDLAQIEFQYVPAFTQIGLLLDIAPYVSKTFKTKFEAWTISQVSGPKGQIYGVPQDTGPMGMLYRKDIFDKYGIAVPKTWADFAAAAAKLHAADPTVYLANFGPNEADVATSFGWQAGARPFKSLGNNSYKINVDDPVAQKIAKYWAGLVSAGTVSTDPAWNNDWFAGFDKGKYATWLTGAWGPLFLAGQAKDTAGLWRAAPLPQWSAGQSVSGNRGGSSTAVIKGTKNPIAAATFAEFLNSDPIATPLLSQAPQLLFPASSAALHAPAFLNAKVAFFGGQQANKVFVAINKTVAKDFAWSPFTDQVYQEWQNDVGVAITGKTDVVAALATEQGNILKYALDQGFTVSK